MALNLEAMREKLNASKNGNKKSNDTKWKPEQGDQTIRILPTKDGDPFKEYHFHYNVGKNPGIMCPKRNFNEECPICDFASSLWKEGVTKALWILFAGLAGVIIKLLSEVINGS